MGLTKAMRNTERHNEATIMPNFAPEGYSGSSEGLSNAFASSRGVLSTTSFSPSCSNSCLEEVGTGIVSFSVWLVDEG